MNLALSVDRAILTYPGIVSIDHIGNLIMNGIDTQGLVPTGATMLLDGTIVLPGFHIEPHYQATDSPADDQTCSIVSNGKTFIYVPHHPAGQWRAHEAGSYPGFSTSGVMDTNPLSDAQLVKCMMAADRGALYGNMMTTIVAPRNERGQHGYPEDGVMIAPGKIQLCEYGLHATDVRNVDDWFTNSGSAETVRVSGDIQISHNKIVAQIMDFHAHSDYVAFEPMLLLDGESTHSSGIERNLRHLFHIDQSALNAFTEAFAESYMVLIAQRNPRGQGWFVHFMREEAKRMLLLHTSNLLATFMNIPENDRSVIWELMDRCLRGAYATHRENWPSLTNGQSFDDFTSRFSLTPVRI